MPQASDSRMSSPFQGDFYDASETPIFRTPTKKSRAAYHSSPLKREMSVSPLKRGIIVPIPHTPKGRAGLPSPRKKTVVELEKSARKRANNTKNRARLMREEEFDSEDDLDEQDQALADAIIKSSRNGPIYGEDIEFEEDLTIGKSRNLIEEVESDFSEDEYVQPKKERAKRRKLAKSETIKEKNHSQASTSPTKEKTLESKKDDLQATKNANLLTTDKKKLEEQISGLEKEDGGEVESSQSPRKRGRPRNKELADTPKRKVGRPSKASEIIGNIQSIFTDDTNAFNDLEDVDLLPVKNTSHIFSGREEDKAETLETKAAFEPMAIPKVNEFGEIQDDNFISNFLKVGGAIHPKLSDDGAIFLEGTEGYFEQHSVRTRPSGNSLSHRAPPLEYSEFISMVQLGQKFQQREKKALHKMYQMIYAQWCFELSQGFNLHLYGVGSKRLLILRFLEDFVFDWFERCYQQEPPQILVVNGYNPAVRIKSIVNEIVSVFITSETRKVDNLKFPKHVSETVPFLLKFIESKRIKDQTPLPKVILAVNSIDGSALRDVKTQMLLSQLCSIPEICLICSSDNLNVSLLWDLHKLKNFNFIFHNATTYESHSTEVSFKDILSMGRSTKFSGERGAKYVLTSLTKNAKSLYKMLLNLQMETIDNSGGSKAIRSSIKGGSKYWLELKKLYNACLEAFITSNEISFRTVLGEFMEHKMCNLTKDDSGTEYIYIPFSYGEMQKLLEFT